MIIQISSYQNFLYALLVILGLFIIVVLSRALFFKNYKVKKLNIESNDQIKYYQERLFELIKIDTPSFTQGESYYKFKEKIEEQFPLVHKYLQKEKIDGNAVYTYKSNIEESPSILFASHIDYSGSKRKAHIKDDFIYGNGTFDSKSLLYVIFEGVESVLRENGKIDVNLTIVITNDDEANKDGLNNIINIFLKRGCFFNLVVEEGSGIIDPEVYNIKSNYALIGLGVSGQIKLRFESNDIDNLNKFKNEIKKRNIFKMKIDNKSTQVLSSIAKDMKFKDRIYMTNLWLFSKKSKKIIENKYFEIEKMLKTNVCVSDVNYMNDTFYLDTTFELSNHEKAADVLMHLDDLMDKYHIDYKIVSVKESSRITNTYTYGYSVIKNAINYVFKDLYIAPVIVTKISEKRYFDKVSDCVIRFSPLYYNFDAFNAANTNNSFINSTSLENGVKFFKYILENYNKKR